MGKAAGRGQHAGSGSNVAVFEYVNLQNKTSYLIKMADKTGHAEAQIVATLERLKIPPKNVKRIYSELDSCVACTKDVRKYMEEGAEGFYSFELNDVGRRIWKDEISKLYNYLFNSKK